MKHYQKATLYFSLLFTLFIFTQCSNTVNVYDYYVLNNLANHESGNISSSKMKLLFRDKESGRGAQLEMIAFKSGSTKYMVIGSHKMAKPFYLNDSIYYFDIDEVYSNVKGSDFIRQLGDLSIYFTHISMKDCNTFIKSVEKLTEEFNKASPADGARSHIDYTIQSDVFISIEKKYATQSFESSTATIWIGKRKHNINLDDFINAMHELTSFE